jgi:hypothetical protein
LPLSNPMMGKADTNLTLSRTIYAAPVTDEIKARPDDPAR